MIISAEEFVSLSASENPAEHRRAAADEAPISVWLDVIRRFPDYRFGVAHNKTIPIEILELLAKDSDDRVRWMVASKNKLTPDLLKRLARDPDEAVRQRVVRHKGLPLEVLNELRSDSSKEIRLLAADRLSRLQRE